MREKYVVRDTFVSHVTMANSRVKNNNNNISKKNSKRRTKASELCIMKNLKNKKEDEERARYMESMGQKAVGIPRVCWWTT